MRKFSRKAVFLATNSEYGDRLVQIAQEHIKLSRKTSNLRNKDLKEASKLFDRMDQLRQERDSILEQFEMKTKKTREVM